MIVDRKTGALKQETVLGDKFLRLAYFPVLRSLFGVTLFRSRTFSRLMGFYADTAFSRRKIPGTIAQLSIDMDECVVPPQGFVSFNDFFCRRLKPGARVFATGKNTLCSPADCRLTVWPQLSGDTCVPVKGAQFTIAELLGAPENSLSDTFQDGSLCICRLCPADYHRYHYPASGNSLQHWRVGHTLHSVSPLALARNVPVFRDNIREVSILDVQQFGVMAFIEVGAFGVAAITQTHQAKKFERGDEKGFFTFGGSTIVMAFAKNKVTFDQDLIDNSQKGLETLVQTGEQIATSTADTNSD